MTLAQAQKQYPDAMEISGRGTIPLEGAARIIYGHTAVKLLYSRTSLHSFRFIFSRAAYLQDQPIKVVDEVDLMEG